MQGLYRKLLEKIRSRLTSPVTTSTPEPETVTEPEDEPAPERRLTAEDRVVLKDIFSHKWDGVTSETSLRYGWLEERKEWDDALERCNWPQVVEILDKKGANPNEWQISGSTLNAAFNTALHRAADAGAPLEVVKAMVDLGGWRTIRNASGATPFDIAFRKRHIHLLDILKPVIHHDVSMQDLRAIQGHFHACLNKNSFIQEHNLRLPQLVLLLEREDAEMYFPIPRMHGGIAYFLDQSGPELKLIFKYGSRVVDGPSPRNEVTTSGSVRIESMNP